MKDRLTLYKIGSYINLGLFVISLFLWMLFGCLSQIASPKNMTFAALFFVFLPLSIYTFASWLLSKKAINRINENKENNAIHTANICLGLFFTCYPAIVSKKEVTSDNKEKVRFAIPRLDFEILGISLAVCLLLLDLITKLTVVNYFANTNEPIIVADGFLRINYVINIAAAFGFGVGNPTTNRVVYCIFATLILGGIIFAYIYKRKKMAPAFKICLLVIASGALGNLIDRLFYSPEFLHSPENGVVDWIDFYNIWGFNFNIADCCVVLGAIALIIYLIVDEVRISRNNRKPQPAGKVLSVEESKRLEEARKAKESDVIQNKEKTEDKK